MHQSMSSPRGAGGGGGGGQATHRNLTVAHIARVGILVGYHAFDLGLDTDRCIIAVVLPKTRSPTS